MVDKIVDRHGTRKVAEEYLKYLYSKEGQEIVARHYYRPRDPQVAAKYTKPFPEHSAGDHRRGFRRLGQGPGHAFRGPWYFR